jgi:hypothetical protein
LAESFPASEDDYVAARYFPMGPSTVEYRESLFVGYRSKGKRGNLKTIFLMKYRSG